MGAVIRAVSIIILTIFIAAVLCPPQGQAEENSDDSLIDDWRGIFDLKLFVVVEKMILKGKRANSTTLKPLELEPLPPIESSKDSSFTQILLYILASAFLVVLFVGIVYCLAKCR